MAVKLNNFQLTCETLFNLGSTVVRLLALAFGVLEPFDAFDGLDPFEAFDAFEGLDGVALAAGELPFGFSVVGALMAITTRRAWVFKKFKKFLRNLRNF